MHCHRARHEVGRIPTSLARMVRAEGDTAQVNELLCKLLCHNLCCVIQSMYELGVEPEF